MTKPAKDQPKWDAVEFCRDRGIQPTYLAMCAQIAGEAYADGVASVTQGKVYRMWSLLTKDGSLLTLWRTKRDAELAYNHRYHKRIVPVEVRIVEEK